MEPALPRRKGRPRDAGADERILAAAADLILQRGYDNMTVDEVAATAKAGKATVYRRWAGKEDLAFAALEQLYSQEFPVPDTGNITDDLRASYKQVLEFANSEAGLAYLRMSITESLRDERIATLYIGAHQRQERAARAVFERAIERGELRADFRTDLAVSQLGGIVVLRAVVGGMPTEADVEDMIDLILKGIEKR
ncbi:TetR/AcrR family transcriptional regulator [Nocardioides marmorisolisilvae]|uniref:TetR/AcrR family transcriptional regulator n=2 Tax=Nocardioides marmorisolisilvae TaxID=1542737 RepID=A0A3N0DW62_9ACTN|nr:TetR/AcrR family transcriptional regulator [Nocardioides marmorisolisilvae]